jgi:hypothetical protein
MIADFGFWNSDLKNGLILILKNQDYLNRSSLIKSSVGHGSTELTELRADLKCTLNPGTF